MDMVLATARVQIVVNTQSLNTQLAGVQARVEMTAKKWSTSLNQLSRNINRISAPLVALSKLYMATFIAGSAKALHALAQMHTMEGFAWKRQVGIFRTQFTYEMARIGALLLKTPIFGRTLPSWMNQLIAWLRRLDLSKVREMVKWFERAAILWGSLKAITMTLRLGAGLTGLVGVLQGIGRSAKVGAVAQGLGGMSNAASGLMGAGAGVVAGRGITSDGKGLDEVIRGLTQSEHDAISRSAIGTANRAGPVGSKEWEIGRA